MKPDRKFTVTRARLRDSEPQVELTPLQALEQVEMLRRIHEELRGSELGKIQLVVHRRPLKA
ncbi:hypothetical protein JST97_13705 [bacterium]|nr:hypothetical protein [bacterium]